VDNSHRALHGGLLDAQILGDVYIALTSGQEEIGFGLGMTMAAAPARRCRPSIPASCCRAARGGYAVGTGSAAARLERLRKKAGHALWDGPKVEEPASAYRWREGAGRWPAFA
jgi:DNA polymerase-3 subunit epsilon